MPVAKLLLTSVKPGCHAGHLDAKVPVAPLRVMQTCTHLTFEYKSQRASLDLFHVQVLGGVEENNAWSPKGDRRSGTPGQHRRQLEFQDMLACSAQQKPKLAPGSWKLQGLAKDLSISETSSSAGSLGFAAEDPGV
ncbi:hypothetical protein BTVI_78850 [Pitangus sulphuratus]|nr:hypothetical protein BTVI_78850 [Pitangus sulphuratus]